MHAPKTCSALASLQNDITSPSWIMSELRAPAQHQPAQALENGSVWIQSDPVSQRPLAPGVWGVPAWGWDLQVGFTLGISAVLHSLCTLQPAGVLKYLGIFLFSEGECSPNRWAQAAEVTSHCLNGTVPYLWALLQCCSSQQCKPAAVIVPIE